MGLDIITTYKEKFLPFMNKLQTERPEVVESHHRMMLYLDEHKIPVSVPVLTVAGQTYCSETLLVHGSDTQADFLVQLLHYIPGVTFLEADNSLDLLPEVGRIVGKMDTALKELTRLPDIASHIPSHCNSDDRQMGQDIVRAYEEQVFPILNKLQSEAQFHISPTYVISGLIDFVDACSSFYVYELATIMADIMASCFHKHDPFRIAKQIFRGYKEEFSLNDGEIKIVKLIICARTLQAYVLSGMDAEDDPEKEYLTLERHESIELCRHLWNIEDNEFLTKLML